MFQIDPEFSAGAEERGLHLSAAASKERRNGVQALSVPIASEEDHPALFGQSPQKRTDEIRQGLVFQVLLRPVGGWNTGFQLSQQQRCLVSAPFLSPFPVPTIQTQVPGDAPQPGPECAWPGRGNGVPGAKIRVIDTLFRVVMAAENIPGDAAEKGPVFARRFRNGLLRPVPV